MKRRSITLLPAIENAVRDFQADLLKFLQRDVTFTESLNIYVLGGLMTKSGEAVKELGKDALAMIVDDPERHMAAIIDDVETARVKSSQAQLQKGQNT